MKGSGNLPVAAADVSADVDPKSYDIIAGAMAGTVARMLTAPLDVLKIRAQLHFGEAAPSAITTVRSIIKEEGVFALWKGNVAATYLWISYGMAQFFLYGTFKAWGEKSLHTLNKSQDSSKKTAVLKNLTLFLAGAAAGMGATAATYPFDIMRTQFAMQGSVKTYPTIKSFITTTLSTRGVPGFYAGVSTAVVSIGPYMGFNFLFYESIQTSTKKFFDSFEVDSSTVIGNSLIWLKNGLCGGLAGGLSKMIVYPLDTVKRRMQIQVLTDTVNSAQTIPKFATAFQCFRSTLAAEGIKGLYKGLGPTLGKSILATGITFATYEGTKDFLRRRRKARSS